MDGTKIIQSILEDQNLLSKINTFCYGFFSTKSSVFSDETGTRQLLSEVTKFVSDKQDMGRNIRYMS